MLLWLGKDKTKILLLHSRNVSKVETLLGMGAGLACAVPVLVVLPNQSFFGKPCNAAD
jgi:hypothetical protein